MSKASFLLLSLLVLLQCPLAQPPRSVIDFNRDWKFLLGNDSAAIQPSYDDSKWRKLSLPHDWSIESDFTKNAPATTQGGALPGGIGWYRKRFVLPASAKDKNVRIEFDGVYKNSEVWINGHYLGKRPNGYVPFGYDLTPFIRLAPAENVIAVKADNSQQPDSRWYSGSGIYRSVKLIITSAETAVDHWGSFITTEVSSNKKVRINVTAKLVINKDSLPAVTGITVNIYNKEGRLVHAGTETLRIRGLFKGDPTLFEESIELNDPQLWSPHRPYLYRAVIKITAEEKLVDEYATVFGIRYFNFDSEKGFSLNGQPFKIRGVCMHHDLGALGAAFNKAAAGRQLKILKEMGCNAIRTAHNPPAAEFLDLCDEMGFLVIDEAYDIWKKRKNKFDYHLYFDEWAEKDAQAMVLRDRNHPSVIIWSIGNEQREQFDSTGTVLVKKLVDAVKAADGSRPVTTALTETVAEKNFIAKANALDVLGFNYKYYDYPELPKRFPGQKFIATETASALATRGVYPFLSDSIRIWPPDYKAQDTFSNSNGIIDYTVSAYDNTHAYWGGTHEKTWLAVKKHPHMAGIFVWSGFDFLGEPLPYSKFPARSSYYGIIDLAGFPKDVYYMYQSEWISKPVLHIFPHWNWKKGDTIDVWAYYSFADEVELFLNGRSLGKRKKSDDKLHVMWRVPFAPGSVKAVSRKNGKIVLVKEIRTAGQPARIELTADRRVIMADGKDLSFITARVVDRNGNTVPGADHLIRFSVSGNGILAGTDNGYQADTGSLKSPERKSWKGMTLAIIQSTEKKGNITLKADSAGLLPAVLSLKTSD
ncbi:MAG: DUF4982 domain-containing protein [Chitinophagaceae bacterium]|nr:DUF4982 domain-containing protein [Chitinophagaceae bacterium]